MTPAVPEYVRDREDVQLLTRMHGDYQVVTREAYDEVCGSGGLALNLHTYAPRSVHIDRIDDRIVEVLREAYRPGRFEEWEPRPDIDLISEDPEGRRLAPPGLVSRVKREYEAIGIEATENATYRLHAETMSYVHASAHGGRVFCIEINRGLLADPFVPFREMRVAQATAARMAAPLVAALSRFP
jgi:hypothetical protein